MYLDIRQLGLLGIYDTGFGLNYEREQHLFWLTQTLKLKRFLFYGNSFSPENVFCSPGWFKDGLSCYQTGNESATYIQAEINCRQSYVGGHLVSIRKGQKKMQKDLLEELLTRHLGITHLFQLMFFCCVFATSCIYQYKRDDLLM